MKAFAGVDIGSATTKAVVCDGTGAILGKGLVPTGGLPQVAAQKAIDLACAEAVGRDDVEVIVATGYGRVKADFADLAITEITCHARGAKQLVEGCGAVIDIGGQDSKAILVGPLGDVEDFKMNDKCAAGTGRFIEVIAHTLEIGLDEVGPLSGQSTDPAKVSAMCAVFAESAVVSLRAEGRNIPDILAGVHAAVARRVRGMAHRLHPEKRVVCFTGGVALNEGMHAALARELRCDVTVPENAQYVGAYGAALLGRERLRPAAELVAASAPPPQPAPPPRVDVSELEALLSTADPSIAEVAVVAGAEGEYVAVVTPASADTEALAAFARTRLPKKVRPARILSLDALPRTPSGELDRSALAAVEPAPTCGACPEVLDEPVPDLPAGALAAWARARAWAPVPAASRTEAPPDSWVVLGADSDLTAGVLQGLVGAGARARHVVPTGSGSPGSIGPFALAQQLEGAEPGRRPLGVVCMWGADVEDSAAAPATARTLAADVLHLVQAVLAMDGDVRLWLVTRGSVPVGQVGEVGLAQAPLWALPRMVTTEAPRLSCTCVDVDARDPDPQLLTEELLAPSGDRIALRGGLRYGLRDGPVEPSTADGGAYEMGSYLIAGGLSALGRLAARALVQEGAAHVVLAQAGGGEVPPELHGASVSVVDADVSLPADVERLVDLCRERASLKGVIVAATAPEDEPLVRQTAERLHEVLAPTVDGAWLLHECTRHLPLDLFVLCAPAGGGGAFLEALAHFRRGLGLSAIAVDWGEGIEAVRGVQLLRALLTSDAAQVVLAQEVEAPAPEVASAPVEELPLRDRLLAVADEERHDVVLGRVVQIVGGILGETAPDPIRTDLGLMYLGVDSVKMLELQSLLGADFDTSLSITVFFDHPTLDKLAAHLLAEHGP